jgi:hypothetical protein
MRFSTSDIFRNHVANPEGYIQWNFRVTGRARARYWSQNSGSPLRNFLGLVSIIPALANSDCLRRLLKQWAADGLDRLDGNSGRPLTRNHA